MSTYKRRIVVLHCLGNAAILLLGYYWLGLPESDAAHLTLSAAVIVFFALAAVWLHGTALVVFGRECSVMQAGKRSLQSVLPLLLLAGLVLLLYLALQRFYNSFEHQAFVIGSYSTMKLRRPVEPQSVLNVFHGIIWLLRWFVVPALAWPLAAEIAERGWSGYSMSAFRKRRRFLFWIQTGIFSLLAVLVPMRLFFWIPDTPGFGWELVSVMARLGCGYLLFTGGLLAVEYFTSAGRPRVTQLSTAGLP